MAMDWGKEWRALALMAGGLAVCFFLPLGVARFDRAVMEALHLVQWYAREHVLLCLVPAFFIAGAIGVFVGQASVMRYLGPGANQAVAYGVAATSGTVLAVCSCTVLPLFAGIYRMGAGLGPACAFLYSGPAINVLAIILTARVLGPEMGIARAVGAVVFSVVIGLGMHALFRREEQEKARAAAHLPEPDAGRPLWQNGLYFAAMVAVLVFANWGEPAQASGPWHGVYGAKWLLTSASGVALACVLALWFGAPWWKVALAAGPVVGLAVVFPQQPAAAFTAGLIGLAVVAGSERGELNDWLGATWGFAKQIVPLLFLGVLIAGLLLGRPGEEGLIPSGWIAGAVGGNTVRSNLFASVLGAFMYFATLTEVPILQGLLGNGMGKGPALALLLAGPALSLPNMLVIRSVLGTRKTVAYVILVVVMATLSGILFGAITG